AGFRRRRTCPVHRSSVGGRPWRPRPVESQLRGARRRTRAAPLGAVLRCPLGRRSSAGGSTRDTGRSVAGAGDEPGSRRPRSGAAPRRAPRGGSAVGPPLTERGSRPAQPQPRTVRVLRGGAARPPLPRSGGAPTLRAGRGRGAGAPPPFPDAVRRRSHPARAVLPSPRALPLLLRISLTCGLPLSLTTSRPPAGLAGSEPRRTASPS